MIEIRQLSYQYPNEGPLALKGVDLSIHAGQLFGLLGPNGAGKTTLLSILSGLLPCDPGTVLVNGIDLEKCPSGAMEKIALVPQELAFYPSLSVDENLRFFSEMQRIPESEIGGRIQEAAQVAGLEDVVQRRADRLSGGLKRRLNLAIGWLNEPDVLFLDEPTVGIDPHPRHFILEAIKKLNARGAAIVYTSHYMEEVESLCDVIAILDRGEILVQGKLEDIMAAEKLSDDIRNLEDLFLKLTGRSLRD